MRIHCCVSVKIFKCIYTDCDSLSFCLLWTQMLFLPPRSEVFPLPWIRLTLRLALTGRILWKDAVRLQSQGLKRADGFCFYPFGSHSSQKKPNILRPQHWGNQAWHGKRPHGDSDVQSGPCSSAIPGKTADVIEEAISDMPSPGDNTWSRETIQIKPADIATIMRKKKIVSSY